MRSRSDPSRPKAAARPYLPRLMMTLLAWAAAFGIVMALFALGGERLESLPLAAQVLVITGVLVAVMSNLVVPQLSALVERLLGSGIALAILAEGDVAELRRIAAA